MISITKRFKLKRIISISALLVLCLTFALGVAGCRSTNPQKLSYWYGNYQVRNNAYGVVVFVWKNEIMTGYRMFTLTDCGYTCINYASKDVWTSLFENDEDLLNQTEWIEEEMEEFRSGVKIEKKGFITAKHKWATPKELSAYCMLTEDENEKRFFRFFGDEALETNDDNGLSEIDMTEQMRYIHYVTIAQTDDIRWDINVEIILTRI